MYDEMVTAILVIQPKRLVFLTNTQDAALPAIRAQIEAGKTPYQQQYVLGPMVINTNIVVINAEVSNKRQQTVDAFQWVDTEILVNADDPAILHPEFLAAAPPAFADNKVGFVGTRKWVKRLRLPRDPTANFFTDLWTRYCQGFWKTIGGLYLIRHNFEVRSTNAAEGGVFCVSGRTSLIRTKIVNDTSFIDAFCNEYILKIGGISGFGPVKADDDNFDTRRVVKHGYDIKIQYSTEATMTSVF